MSRVGSPRGQASVEWVGLTLLLSLALAVGLAAAPAPWSLGLGLGEALAERLVCAVRLVQPCRHEPALLAAHGPELAGLLRERAPTLVYEAGMRALPVDPRRCRSTTCADGPLSGGVTRSFAGERVVAFTHAVDCRNPLRPRPPDADCSGQTAGRLYLQYWLYYPDSATMRGVPVVGGRGFHLDDWESFMVRVSPRGIHSRASSHNGYNGRPSVGDWASDAAGQVPGAAGVRRAAEATGLREQGGWTLDSRRLFVSGGSHAGAAKGARRLRRYTPAARLALIPLDVLERRSLRFAVIPPWRKRVYLYPEYRGTD